MNTSFENVRHVFFRVLAAMTLLIALGGQAQNLFVSSDVASGYITETLPGVSTNVYASGFDGPAYLAFDSFGNLFVANVGSGNIIKITPGGTQIPFAGGLEFPVGLAMDNSNDLFVADADESCVYEYSPKGTPTKVVSNVPVNCLALDSAGNLYVGDYQNDDIYEFTNNGGIYSSNSIVFATVFARPQAMVFDSVGDLFVDCYYYYNGAGGILEITPGGLQNDFSYFYANNPATMVFNSAGDLLVSDASQGTVQAFTPGGVQSTYASGLIGPAGLAFQPPSVTPPTLGIAPSGNQSVLFWPATNGNFLLQSINSFNSSNWTTVSNCVPVLGFVVTNTAPSQFFRLEQY